MRDRGGRRRGCREIRQPGHASECQRFRMITRHRAVELAAEVCNQSRPNGMSVLQRRQVCRPVDKPAGPPCGRSVRLPGFNSSRDCPGKPRRIKFRDVRNARELAHLSNSFDLPTPTFTLHRKSRWQVQPQFLPATSIWAVPHFGAATASGRALASSPGINVRKTESPGKPCRAHGLAGRAGSPAAPQP